jgi:hypothetical protein
MEPEMNKMFAFLNVLRVGQQVDNPAAWKTGQISANALAALFVALAGLARALGASVEITDVQSLAIAGGVLAFVNVVLTAVTSQKVGLLPRSEPDRLTIISGDPRGN